MDIESEDWVTMKDEFHITEGGQRDLIGIKFLPALGIEVRQNKVAGYMQEVGTDSTLTSIGEYSPIQRSTLSIY